ncbi:hypothetical protein ACA910_022673 [Epithemia clementina (nom. ined.)]
MDVHLDVARLILTNGTASEVHSIRINKNGGLYQKGKSFSNEKRLMVVMKYEELLEAAGDDRKVSCSQLASAAHVSKSTASRIICEYHDNDGKISLLSSTGKNTPKGVGIKSLYAGDEMVLLLTYYSNPKTMLKTYQITLYQQTGTYVS